jgi:UDP-N-acetylmuramoylalanine--D-glutamate ligase
LFLNKDDQVSRHIAKSKKIKPKIIWYGGEGAVLAICKYLGLNKKSVQGAIKTFSGLEGRLEYVATINKVKYYNDTCATNPDATIYAIKNVKCQMSNVKSNLILIAGGEDKNLDYNKLAQFITKKIKPLILFKGSASVKIIKSLKKYPNIPISQYPNIKSMQQAVSIAKNYAKPNDIVLLSPAAASFNMFKHEFERGSQFKKEVKANIKYAPKTT